MKFLPVIMTLTVLATLVGCSEMTDHYYYYNPHHPTLEQKQQGACNGICPERVD